MNSIPAKKQFSIESRVIGDFEIKWTVGGRIILKTISTGETSTHVYSSGMLASVIEHAEGRDSKHWDRACMHFNPEALNVLGSKFFTILQDETSIYLLPNKSKDTEARTISQSRSGSYCSIMKSKLGHIQANSRYHLSADGELTFFEEISIHNFNNRYDEAIVSFYKIRERA